MSTAAASLGWKVPPPALAPREPSAEGLAQLERVMGAFGWAARLGTSAFMAEVEVEGREHLAQGPLLVLMNHRCAFDPWLLTVHARRPIQFLITEPVMSLGTASRLVAWWGQIPKRKLDPDARALRTLKGWTQLGGAVGLFPEGQFPWDGRPLPLQPGLPQLVSYLGVPVVTARLFNSDRVWPPWAKHPRHTRLRLEIDPPRRLAFGEVEAYVAERIRVDPDGDGPRWPAEGRRLAEGLARFLRLCPECGEDRALTDGGEELRCAACHRVWFVTADNVLHAAGGSSPLAEVLSQVKTHFRARWRASRRFESLGPADVVDVSRRELAHLARGQLVLDGGTLHVGAWSLQVKDVLAHTLDWDARILLRTAQARLALRLPHDSRALWTLALEEARG
ncbi:MAG: 1-acyl-sn-glycerol-3-phosphate acyltransferase [Myxococcaceae bacterium]|nr:1-acyl-sn-glycerol-3-phosphate acyltransferase [Myxococcaceae bacterium]